MSPRAALARHPIAVEIAQSIQRATESDSEVVVFEAERAFIAAASKPDLILQPRTLVPGERALLDGAEGTQIEPSSASVPIKGPGQTVVGAITIHYEVLPASLEMIEPLARILSTLLGDDSLTKREAGFEAHVLQSLRDPVVVLNDQLQVTWVSDAVGSLFGRTSAEVVGMSAAELLHPEDMEVALNAVARMTDGLEMYRVFVRISSNDGNFVPVEITGFDASADPDVGGLVLSLRAAGSGELGPAIERSRRMADAIVGQLHDGIVAADAFGAVTLLNSAARTLFGLNPETHTAHFSLADFEVIDPRGHTISAADICTPDFDELAEGDMCVVTGSGAMRYVTIQHSDVLAPEETNSGSVVVFHDVTAEHLATEELRNQALHDQLTGLPNRRSLDHAFAALRADARRTPVAVSFLDLDGFKVVNDMHGHRVGDDVIRIAADRLCDVLRSGDLLVRLGGDEFVAIHRDVNNVDDAVLVADKLRQALSPAYRVADERFDLTTSVGVAFSADGGESEDRLLQQADIALYTAKARGRNRVVAFTDQLAEGVLAEEHQRRILRDALDNNRLIMHFQPLIDSQSGKASGYEALARIQTESGDIIGPPAFLNSIASSSLLWELDRAAFTLSCEAAATFAKVQPTAPPMVACNFSPVSLTQRDLLDFISGTAERHGVEPGQICIEITESAAFEAGPSVLRTLESLTDRGFGLALDDFGTGYSPLSHLRDLPITTVKVDRTFIANIEGETNERAIAEAVVVLAKQLGLGVVAEGVESIEQRDRATEMGFNTLQGWHYAPALPLADCLAHWAGIKPVVP